MKLKRVTFYFIDHESVSDNEVKEMLQNCNFPNDCISPHQITVEETDIGQWNDDHRCNYCSYDLSQEFKK